MHPDPWALHPGDFPRGGPLAAQLRFLVRYAVLAPSPRNAQPWHFEVAQSRISLYADRSRQQRWADPARRDLYISLGCALENLLLAAAHFGFRPEIAYFPLCEDDELVAQLRFADAPGQPATRPSPLLLAITERRTHHGCYDAEPCGPAVLRKLQACAGGERLDLLLTEEGPAKQAVDRLVLSAEAAAMAQPGYRAELAEAVGAGMLGSAGLAARLGRLAVMHLAGTVRLRQRMTLDSTPAFGLISGRRPGRRDQLMAGRLFERLCLTAATLGLCVQPLSVLLNDRQAALALTGLFPGRGLPLLPFRLGRASPPAQGAPRRALQEVLHERWIPA